MKGFDDWMATLNFEYDQTALNLAFHAYRAGWKARGEVDAEIAEKLSDKFREADQHKWPEMTEDRTQGAEAVEWAIRNQE